MAAILVAESQLIIGQELVFGGASPKHPQFSAVFEDDGETGYFYAQDKNQDGNPIVDALGIYNVADVNDRGAPNRAQICWSEDGLKAALVISDQLHAVFDFSAKRGYCRSGSPPPAPGEWAIHGHGWDDAALALFD